MEIAVFLRAVNLGSKNKVSMGELKAVLEKDGYTQVKTCLNSGNLTMFSQNGISEDEHFIQRLILEKFGIDIDVFAVSIDELRHKIRQELFGELTLNQVAYVVFLREEIALEVPCDLQHIHILALDSTLLYCIGTMNLDHTSFPNALLEKKFKVRCTSRNLNTLKKMLAAS